MDTSPRSFGTEKSTGGGCRDGLAGGAPGGYYAAFTERVRKRIEDEGVEVVTWTVNEPEEATRLRQSGVTGFTTDEVDRLLAWAGQESG